MKIQPNELAVQGKMLHSEIGEQNANSNQNHSNEIKEESQLSQYDKLTIENGKTAAEKTKAIKTDKASDDRNELEIKKIEYGEAVPNHTIKIQEDKRDNELFYKIIDKISGRVIRIIPQEKMNDVRLRGKIGKPANMFLYIKA